MKTLLSFEPSYSHRQCSASNPSLCLPPILCLPSSKLPVTLLTSSAWKRRTGRASAFHRLGRKPRLRSRIFSPSCSSPSPRLPSPSPELPFIKGRDKSANSSKERT